MKSPLCSPAEQLLLFDAGIDVSHLRSVVQEVRVSGSIAPLSDRSYRSSWNLFCEWCRDSGRVSLPASSETLALYVAWCVRDAGYKLTSVKGHVSAIRYKHRVGGFANPVDDSVRELVTGLARQLKQRPKGRSALTPAQLLRMSRLLAGDGSVIATRDRSILVVGFALGWRGSELARLDVADVSFEAKGLRVIQRWSKTDQEGKGREVGVPAGVNAETCPVIALREWLAVRGRWDGPLFCVVRKDGSCVESRITGEVVNRVLKGRMVEAGMAAKNYGSHSLRAGMITAAGESGATETAIMQRSGHRSIEMVLRYTRPARAFACDPLQGVL